MSPPVTALRTWLLPLSFWLLGLGFAFWPTFASGFSRMQVDPGDTRHLNYVLEHGHRWLWAPGSVKLWSPSFFHPQENVAAYTELLLGVVPFYSAFRLLGLEPDSAFQGWMVLMASLNFLVAWLLFRKAARFQALPAAAASFLFAFGGSRLAQLNHQHLLPHFFTLLCVLALVMMFRADTSRRAFVSWWACFAASLVLQVYAGIYYAWFFLFCLGVLTAWALLHPQTRAQVLGRLGEHWLAVSVGVLACALFLGPLAHPYWLAAQSVGYRSFGEAAGMVPRIQSWVHVGPQNWLYGWMSSFHTFSSLPVEGEHRIGLGLLTSGVMGVGLWRGRRRPWVRALGLTVLTVVLCATMYRWQLTPWRWVFDYLPGANALRAVSRIGILMLLPAAWMLADVLQQGWHGGKRGWTLAILGWCVLEQGRSSDHYDKAEQRTEVAAVARLVGPQCQAFLYAPPPGHDYPEKNQLDAMWAQLLTGVPTVNGYSSNAPKDWPFHHPVGGSEAARAQLLPALARWAHQHGLNPEGLCLVP